MQRQRHYSKAPIREAVIDLRVTLPEGFPVDTFADIRTFVSDRFPTAEPIYTGTGALVFQPGLPVQMAANQEHNGFLFRSEDNKKVFQARLNGFTFNRLAPYESWEEFSSDAKYLWEIYKTTCKPIHIIRAAVRFINQLNIPTKELGDLREYLSTVPEVAPTLPQKLLSSFFMQLQLPQEDLNCMLIINEALAPPTDPEFVSIILDFDLFREQIWQSDDEVVWYFLEELRHRKNQVFEACITDKTRRLIE
jgi:uncharacterized protein (TIGR04255 family)